MLFQLGQAGKGYVCWTAGRQGTAPAPRPCLFSTFPVNPSTLLSSLAIYRGVNPCIPVDTTQLDLELGLLFVKPPLLTDAQKQSIVAPYHYVQVWNIVTCTTTCCSSARRRGFRR